MGRLEVKREKGKFRMSLFYSNHPRKKGNAHYWNIIDKDANKLAQVFIDLYLEGVPIEKAFKLMQERLRRKDWLGLS